MAVMHHAAMSWHWLHRHATTQKLTTLPACGSGARMLAREISNAASGPSRCPVVGASRGHLHVCQSLVVRGAQGMTGPRSPWSSDASGRRRAVTVRAKDDDSEPDWNKEMSIFQKRISRPNQLATLRELESKVSVGKVLFVRENLAIISGLNSDAPVGTKLSFVTGGSGVLLWHRSSKLAFAIILGGASMISVGEAVECKIRGVLQVVDEVKGPVTRKDYEIYQSPAGDALFGRVVNCLGYERPAGASATAITPPVGLDKVRPLINAQVNMDAREQITECLLTGVKALDILTPLGRGMDFLVVGPRGSGKTTMGLDAVLAQKSSDVKSIYVSIGRSEAELSSTLQALRSGRVMNNTAVYAAPQDASAGEALATIFAACSLGERVRDEGGHSLVVVDTVKPLVDAWDTFIIGLSELGSDKIREGLIKDSEGREVVLPAPESDEALVEYQGMLVSGAIAQRRGFFSTLLMRPAKLSRTAGGGSMTLIPLVPGRCATGISKRVDMSKYQTLSEEQKVKIQAALEAKMKAETPELGPGEIITEVVEEFISIADGQVILDDRRSSGPYTVNPKLSITRVGTRAYHKAMEALAPQVRLELAQAEDARKFSINAEDPVIKKCDDYAKRIQAALLQQEQQPVDLEEQIVVLLAVQKGYAAGVPPEEVPAFLKGAVKYVWAAAFSSMQEIASTKMLTAAAEKAVVAALTSYLKMWTTVAGL